jgi:polyhydroxyalkanoate synthesis regulator phasin
MEETLKKLVYAGVGLAAQATEKFESAVNDLVKKGKLSDKEGKKIVDDFFKKTEQKKEEFEEKFKSTTEEIVSRFNYAKQADVEALAKRVAKLEKELGGSAKKPAAAKPAVKKPAAKKPAAPKAKAAPAPVATPAAN